MKFVNINDHPNKDEIIEIRDSAIEEFEDQTRDYRLTGMNFSISCNDYLTPTGLEFSLNFELDNETSWIKLDQGEVNAIHEITMEFNDVVEQANTEIMEFLF